MFNVSCLMILVLANCSLASCLLLSIWPPQVAHHVTSVGSTYFVTQVNKVITVNIMQLTRNLIKTHIIKQKKKLIAHLEIFKNNKKNQKKLKIVSNFYCSN